MQYPGVHLQPSLAFKAKNADPTNEVYFLWGLTLRITMNLLDLAKLPRLFPSNHELIWGTSKNPILHYLMQTNVVQRMMMAKIIKQRKRIVHQSKL